MFVSCRKKKKKKFKSSFKKSGDKMLKIIKITNLLNERKAYKKVVKCSLFSLLLTKTKKVKKSDLLCVLYYKKKKKKSVLGKSIMHI